MTRESIAPRLGRLALALALVAAPACTDLLTEKPKDRISTDAFFQTAADAKAAIALACALPGVASCSVIFTDGLIIAGNIPDEMHMEGLSAVAPTMLQKLQKHMCETQLGPLSSITVHGQKSPVTFFGAGDLCLTAVHNGVELSAESRRELGRITQELSRTYPQLEAAHVNH